MVLTVQNKYLKSIANKLGGNMTGRKNNNELLKSIDTNISSISDMDTVSVTVTYTDSSTETLLLYTQSSEE